MDHLSSCYFCGTTLDDTLRDYRVVPVELRETDDTTTATLCQSCHGKLERLLAPVVGAAGAEGATLDARAGSDRHERDDGATADPLDADDTDGPTGADGAGTEPSEPESSGGGGEPPVSDVESNLVDIDEDPLAEAGEAGTPDPPVDSEGTADGDGDATPVGVSDDREDANTGGEDGDGGSEATRTTVSALEYNKVMRLLQNREFPVDRREFVTVAANAYGLAEHECAEVIDLAIDRGLVAERDGKLVRPD